MKQIDAGTLAVLLVSDETDWLNGAGRALRTSGVTNVVALNESGAVLPALVGEGVGVVVLDLTMPRISGQALLERVRADYPDVAVIVLTAASALDVATESTQAGAGKSADRHHAPARGLPRDDYAEQGDVRDPPLSGGDRLFAATGADHG